MYASAAASSAAGEEEREPPEDLPERTRLQYLAVLQYLQDKGLHESLSSLERETRVCYGDGDLPTASVLEASLDMFWQYRAGASAREGEGDAVARADEEELQQLERGACCTGTCAAGAGPERPLGSNVTTVAWVAAGPDDFLALAALASRKLQLLSAEGETLAEFSDLASPVLGLDCAPGAEEVLATCMGGEVLLLRMKRPGPETGSWALELSQRFKDHSKHVTSGRFSPAPSAGLACERAEELHPPAFFVTVSRDHQAQVYARAAGGAFNLAGTVRLVGEVTACCWAGESTFVLAARDDHNLHYWDAAAASDGGPRERLRTNLNALGDSVVSFAVLALAVSPDRRLLAACTDKSRVIVLRTFTPRQLRNLYGAVVEEYDVPSVCFSLDQTFVYATSSLPHQVARTRDASEEEEDAAALGMVGQVVVFELRTGEAVIRLPCHEKAIRCMDRHPHTEHLVTGSFDKTVKFWG